MAYRPDWTQSVKQWALEGETLFYGDQEMQKIGQEKKFPAIIDTGSSNIGVPEAMYKTLKEKWRESLGSDLDCVTDDNFCQIMTPCDKVAPKLKAISL